MSTERQRRLIEGPVYVPEDESWEFYGEEGPNDVFREEADEDCCCWGAILVGVSFFAQSRQLVSLLYSVVGPYEPKQHQSF